MNVARPLSPVFAGVLFTACADTGSDPSTSGPQSPTCELVADGHGPAGRIAVRAQTVVSGLEVPWGIAFVSADPWRPLPIG
jgi:hypothetical protein